ncbi:hypothetical protein [Pelosinus fermentans]|nr:hypothetical protein [Pelosinus fermentans]
MGIHQNPIKAGIVGTLEEYRFSSYRDYVRGGTLTDTAFSSNDHFDVSGS